MFGWNKIPQSLNQWKRIRKKFLWSSAVPELLRWATSPPRAPSLCLGSSGTDKALSCFTSGRSAGDSQRRMPWWIPQWSMIITPQSHPIFDWPVFGFQLRIYLARCCRSSEQPFFSQSLWLAHFTLLSLELLLSVNKDPSLAFPGQQHHLEPPPTCAAPSFQPQLRKTGDKKNVQVLGWKRECGRLNSTSGASKANVQSYTAAALH